MVKVDDAIIGVIGLGYVGLPLAVEFGKLMRTVGYDLDSERILSLKRGQDRTNEVTEKELESAEYLSFTDDDRMLAGCNTYIVTVPTPVDANKQPDLKPLKKASRLLGRLISRGDVIIYESTVYPGATEEQCVPEVERVSGFKINRDFFVGYSPERVNPGDRERRVSNIQKVTSGSTEEAADYIDELYKKVIVAGTHRAPSIRVAEAAKVVENTQRDINIALINELAMIFDALDIDTQDVLDAAGTKWNFLPFRPGLVGGHCIGVDPYYLVHKAQSAGYIPDFLVSARRVNDSMSTFIARRFLEDLGKKGTASLGARVLLMGFSFKENCPDIRNTKVADIYESLVHSGCQVTVYDPVCDALSAKNEYGVKVLSQLPAEEFDGVILAVAHANFEGLTSDRLYRLMTKKGVLYDLKSIYPADQVDFRL